MVIITLFNNVIITIPKTFFPLKLPLKLDNMLLLATERDPGRTGSIFRKTSTKNLKQFHSNYAMLSHNCHVQNNDGLS